MSEMTFKKLHSDIDFNILDNTFDNEDSLFLRRVKRSSLRPEDFESKWEKKDRTYAQKGNEKHKETWEERKRSFSERDLEEVATLKGISTDIHSEERINDILKWYRYNLETYPDGYEYVCYYKLKVRGGKFKHTPTHDNPCHHDLFKSDQFYYETHIESQHILPIPIDEVIECL